MVRRALILFLAAFWFVASIRANVDTDRAVLDEHVRTLQVRSVSDYLATGTPVVVIGSQDVIRIDFDMLDDDRRYLRYEIIHCNSDWQPSALSYLEYLDGFNEGTIDDYEFSAATTVAYVHYRLLLPNEQVQFKVSGNYVVRIYDENNPDETLIRARFCVSEGRVPVAGFVTSRTDVDFNAAHQQLELEVDCEGIPNANLFTDIIVAVEQNGRPDAVHHLGHPLRVSGRRMIFEHQPELIFDAGNEYRRFETVSNALPGMNVDAIEYHAPYYNHYLIVDIPRSSAGYLYDETLNGGFVVREYNSDDSDVEADYVVVHFALEMPELLGADIFLDSDALNRTFGPESRMIYNRGTGRYEKALLLKQGQYNYQYLTVPFGKNGGETAEIEGNKYQTRNSYAVKVYTRIPGERYDRLVGHAIVKSNQ